MPRPTLATARALVVLTVGAGLAWAGVEPGAWGPAALGVSLLAGLWHGGFDHAVAQGWPAWRGLGGQVAFHATYVALAALVLALWGLAPTAALLLFFGFAAWHFGESDLAPLGALGPVGPAAVGTRGLVILAAPMLAWPAQGAEVLTALGGAPAAALLPLTRLWTSALPGALVFLHLATLVWASRQRAWDDALLERALRDALAVAALTLAGGPVVGVALYFLLWHTPDHFALVAGQPGRSLGAVLVVAAPRALAMAALVAALAWWAPADWVRWTLWVTSALTVPHALLTHFAFSPLARPAWTLEIS